MPSNRTMEEKRQIAAEYRQAVAESKPGGGAAVAKKYGITAAGINGWERMFAEEAKKRHGHNGRNGVETPREFVPMAEPANQAAEDALPSSLIPVGEPDLRQARQTVESAILWHRIRLEDLETALKFIGTS